MSVSDRDSGIVAEHIASLEKACLALNTFLFIRPTEYDTTLLIDQGYATKSMSVHDKSSNWGPMAGFVPCDQFFSKKYIGGGPNPNATSTYHDHGPAKVAHLRLTDALVDNHAKMTRVHGKGSATSRIYTSPQAGNETARRIEFELVKAGDGWDVYWLDKPSGKRVPVFCWGYVVNGTATPVTGDYDLWMVAPHMSWWKLHMHTVGVKDEHGSSCATLLNTWLLGKLNEACGRAGNPVFNHGAEAQNYGFTQALDSRLVMITPAGGSRMIPRGEMADVLVDLQSAGYLIYWNKRYGETDPRLSGQKSPIAPMLNELSSELAKIGGPGGRGSGVIKHLLKKDERLRDVVDIKSFYNRMRGLDSELKARGKPKFLLVGEGEDLPADFAEKAGSDATLAAQRALQQAVIGATVGYGEADMDKLEAWVENNIEHVFTLCEAYGEVPGAAGSGREGGFLLEAIPGTGQYKRA